MRPQIEVLEERRLLVVVSDVPEISTGSLLVGSRKLNVVFSEPILGGSTASNYSLRSVGADALLGTADDTSISINASYSGTTATLSLSPPQFNNSLCRLTVFDTITNIGGTQLDGDANGTPGGNFERDFVVMSTDGVLVETISHPAPANGNNFGRSVSISGNLIVVGTPFDKSGAVGAGVASLFDVTGTLLRTFTNPTPAEGDNFGDSVAISGNLVLVGAPNDDTGAEDAGSAYLFDATSGALFKTFNNPAPAASDNFGNSVSISGNLALIGASGDDLGFNNGDYGSAYLFDATSGALLKTFVNSTPQAGDQFGDSVSISGNLVMVGAPWGNFGGTDAGEAFLFDASSGAKLKTFLNPTPALRDFFGVVSILGNRILIGAPWDDTNATDAGSVYLFDATSGNLLKTINNPTPTHDANFGSAVSISGNLVIVGTPNVSAISAGRAHLFDATSGALLKSLNNPTGSSGFGYSVSVSGDQVLVASPFDNTVANGAGVTFLFQWPPSWNLTSPAGYAFDFQPVGAGAGQLVQGPQGVFDGWGRLQINGINYGSGGSLLTLSDSRRTVATPAQTLGSLNISREITVAATGNENFVRTIDVFTNPTTSDITATVRLIGNLGTDGATTVFATSDGDTDLESTDTWFGTDDVDGTGAPAIVQYVHGPLGLAPASISRLGDNVEWTYDLKVPAGATLRLAQLTILSSTQAGAVAAANVLVGLGGFGGQAAAYLTPLELVSVVNFQFAVVPPRVDLPIVTLQSGAIKLQVPFSEPVFGGGAPGNYELRSLGADGLLGTADDPIVPLSATYSNMTATLSFAPLANGVYRLTVLDAVTDVLGTPLDGNEDGTPGGSFARDFVALPLSSALQFNNPTLASSDRFGSSVSLSGNLALVGDPLDDTGAPNGGSAYLFDATSGALLRTFNNPTPANSDEFGSSVSLSGNLVLVGSVRDDAGAADAGSAYLFNTATGAAQDVQ